MEGVRVKHLYIPPRTDDRPFLGNGSYGGDDAYRLTIS